jgi:hypothetical protein
MRLLKKQRSGREYKIQTDTRRREMILLLAGARLLNLMGLIQKNGVMHPSSYSVSLFKEL